MTSKVFVLKCGKCSWGACYFCGFGKIEGYEPSIHNINKDFEGFFSSLNKDVDEIKVFGGGSFFDEKQMPAKGREIFLELCRKHNIKKLTLESRPEFITKEKLVELKDFDYIIAIGLEVADNRVLKKLSKGFSIEDFIKAGELIKNCGGKLRAYLLVNAPFIENPAKVLEKSVNFALEHADSIVLINLYPHYKAPLLDLYLKREWKPLNKEEFMKAVSKWKSNRKVSLDIENFDFIPKIPEGNQKSDELRGATAKVLNHPHFELWQEYLQEFYKIPNVKKYALFLQCSFRKPYSRSKTHRIVSQYLRSVPSFPKIHQLIVSTPGVIPLEFDSKYPFNSYDWPEWEETPAVMKEYVKVIEKRVEDYLRAHKYEKVFVYLKPSSESFMAVQKACKKLGIKCINCFDEKLYKELKANTSMSNLVSHPRALRKMVEILKRETDV